MTLADQIIEHGPYRGGDSLPIEVQTAGDDQLNQLRDELLELRRLRAAAELRKQFKVWIDYWDDTSTLDHQACGTELRLDSGDTLAELVRRADQHGENCP